MENLEKLGTRSTPRTEPVTNKGGLTRVLKVVRDRMITVGSIVGFFVVWELLARAGLLSRLIFPYPTVIFSELYQGLTQDNYGEHLVITLTRIISGFFFGAGAGLLLGMFMGWSRRVRRILDPLISAIHPVPKLSLLPILIIAFGIGESPRIVMISIVTFFPMLISTMGGVLQINPIYYEVLQNYGANRLDIFKKVVLPGSLPYVMSGARLALKSAVTSTVAIEMIFGSSGLGTILFRGWTSFNTPMVYSILIIVSVIGIGSNMLLEWAKRVLVPWHQEIQG